MSKLQLTGVKAVDKALSKLEGKVAKKVIRKAARKAMKPVQKEAIQNAPVGPTGDTKKNVKIRAGKRKKDTISINVQVGEGDFAGDTFYSAMTEFGTKKQPPQGWMRRAYDTKRDEAKRIATEMIAKGVEEQARK